MSRVIKAFHVVGVVLFFSTYWFETSAFQADKENQKRARGAHLKKNSLNCSC